MAYAKFNTSLTYSTNTVEFWNEDVNGDTVPFDTGVVLTIARMDDMTSSVTFAPSVGSDLANGYVRFDLFLGDTASKATLYRDTDSVFDYTAENYEHVYSVKSPIQTYLYGKLNMLEVA